jgi:hypothetical protein
MAAMEAPRDGAPAAEAGYGHTAPAASPVYGQESGPECT